MLGEDDEDDKTGDEEGERVRGNEEEVGRCSKRISTRSKNLFFQQCDTKTFAVETVGNETGEDLSPEEEVGLHAINHSQNDNSFSAVIGLIYKSHTSFVDKLWNTFLPPHCSIKTNNCEILIPNFGKYFSLSIIG